MQNGIIKQGAQSQYPPGSTFKIVTAIAGLEEYAINEDSKVTCTRPVLRQVEF